MFGAVQMFAYDTVKTFLTPKDGEPSRLPLRIPASLVAGATAGVSSTITMYPLELLKTRLTVEVKRWSP
jgi:solute carrier family 25 phosphate transporter 23/24/25/41